MYSRNTANERGRGIIPPYNYGGTVYSRALRDAQDGSGRQGIARGDESRRAGSGAVGTDVGSAPQNIGGARTVRADSAQPVGTSGMNSSGIPAGNMPSGMSVGNMPSGMPHRNMQPGNAQPRTGGVPSGGRGISDGAAVGAAAGRSAIQGMRRGVQSERQPGAQPAGGYAGTAQPNMRAAGAQPRGIRPDGAASGRTVMHVGGRPDGDYPPRSYPDVLGRGGRPTGGDAPRPVRHDGPPAQQPLPDLGALLGSLPPSDDILLIFLLVTLMSARSEGRGGDDLLIAIIALLLLGGR